MLEVLFLRGRIMIEPKFIPYLSGEKKVTKNGYEYIALKDNTPEDMFNEYMRRVQKQDDRIKNGEMVVKY